jgi:hypothetical protein
VAAEPYARVWVDGREIQDTPLVRFELRVGQHIVELKREGYMTVVDTVDVTAGNLIRKRHTMVRTP